MLILTVIRVLIDSVVRPQNNSALQCPCCLDYFRLCCNSSLICCFKIGELHSAMKCESVWWDPDRLSAVVKKFPVNWSSQIISAGGGRGKTIREEEAGVPLAQSSRKKQETRSRGRVQSRNLRLHTGSLRFYSALSPSFCFLIQQKQSHREGTNKSLFSISERFLSLFLKLWFCK